MPNQGNKSNGSSGNKGKGTTGDAIKKASAPKENPERSDKKHGHDNDGNTGRTSNQGRKAASGGNAND